MEVSISFENATTTAAASAAAMSGFNMISLM